MSKYIPWSTVEQLVLVESIENFNHLLGDLRWKKISEYVISTLKMIGTVDQSRFTEDECFEEWKSITRNYPFPAYPDSSECIQYIITYLRRKRIDELDKEMMNMKNKLLQLQKLPSN